jgi:hypothetical protein
VALEAVFFEERLDLLCVEARGFILAVLGETGRGQAAEKESGDEELRGEHVGDVQPSEAEREG